jgi:hypothetical protein
MRFIALFSKRLTASSPGDSRSAFNALLLTRIFVASRKHGEERSCVRLPPGLGGFDRADYRFAKRTLRFACDTDGPTAGGLISYQNLESVADCILSQW